MATPTELETMRQLIATAARHAERASEKADRNEIAIRDLQQDVRLNGQRIARVEERLDRVERRLNGIDNRLDGIDNRLDSMQAGIDRIEAIVLRLLPGNE